MSKVDYKKELKFLYSCSAKKVAEVVVPPLRYLMIDGQGDPNTSPAFSLACEALFAMSYKAKFIVKKQNEHSDYVVMPLEGLWWADDMDAFVFKDKAQWKWTLMVMQPECVTQSIIDEAKVHVLNKKQQSDVSRVRFEVLEEARAAQIMHVGPFENEGPTVEALHTYIDEQGAVRCGKHHEIYLSDVRRANPANWKTIIRQPMVS